MLEKIRVYWSFPSWYRTVHLLEYASHRLPWLAVWYASCLRRRFDKVLTISKRPINGQLLERAYITNIPHVTVGIGHTLSEYNAGRVYAQALGLKYAHCPLPEPWEQLLNFGEGEVSISKLKRTRLKCVRLPRFSNRLDEEILQKVRRFIAWHLKRCSGNILFLLAYGQNVYDHSLTEQLLREKYREGLARDGVLPDAEPRQADRRLMVGPLRKPAFWTPSAHEAAQRKPLDSLHLHLRDLRVPDKVNVAVHFRVPNAADKLVLSESSLTTKNPIRYLDAEYFLKRCREVEQQYGTDRVHFNLFIQKKFGDLQVFDAFQSLRYCDDADAYESFYNMTLSDVLITSPSSFSFKAGMLCNGLKVAPAPWWHKVPENEEWRPAKAS